MVDFEAVARLAYALGKSVAVVVVAVELVAELVVALVAVQHLRLYRWGRAEVVRVDRARELARRVEVRAEATGRQDFGVACREAGNRRRAFHHPIGYRAGHAPRHLCTGRKALSYLKII